MRIVSPVNIAALFTIITALVIINYGYGDSEETASTPPKSCGAEEKRLYSLNQDVCDLKDTDILHADSDYLMELPADM